ncbi:MAG: copper homeostasis protein CutC [Gemmatimonadota bacterium]
MGKTILVEACVDSVESARGAEKGGADRLELCDNLVEGGTTPSAGMIAECRAQVRIPIYVMIRPRGGDFLYTDVELAVMKQDIALARELGADGVVFGMLTSAGKVDRKLTTQLVNLSYPLDVTFHRAIDVARDPLEALEVLVDAGVDRVLTSGGAARAVTGAPVIRAMVERARGRIGILAGSGLNERNVAQLVKRTGVGEVHVRGTVRRASGMKFRARGVSFRGNVLPSDFVTEVTDSGVIRKVVQAVGR